MEFVSYFTDRNLRLTDLKNQLKHFTNQNKKLHDKHKIVQEKYTQVIQLFNNILISNNTSAWKVHFKKEVVYVHLVKKELIPFSFLA